MLNNEELYYCRVCGFRYEQPPWGKDNKTPSFEICSCCGSEFGYNDATIAAVLRFRKKWLKEGAKWYDISEKPENWSLEKQLEQIPEQYKYEIL